jgi:hypothetical protein
MAYLVAGPLIALIGIGAVFFVLRRKSVDKRSMYSARRQQIEHKVRAARQRTLAPHGHLEKPVEGTAAAAAPFVQTQSQPVARYEAPVYQAPPAAPPPPPMAQPETAAAPMPWEQPSIPPAGAPSSFDYPPAAQPEPFAPAPAEPTQMPAPSEPVWTPAPAPAAPLPPAQTVAPAASASTATSTSAGSWEVVSTTKDSSVSPEKASKKKDKVTTGSWQLASGEAPGMEDEPDVRRSAGTLMAVAQYAVLVVGLVMVLIGVLVMVANSHVT